MQNQETFIGKCELKTKQDGLILFEWSWCTEKLIFRRIATPWRGIKVCRKSLRETFNPIEESYWTKTKRKTLNIRLQNYYRRTKLTWLKKPWRAKKSKFWPNGLSRYKKEKYRKTFSEHLKLKDWDLSAKRKTSKVNSATQHPTESFQRIAGWTRWVKQKFINTLREALRKNYIVGRVESRKFNLYDINLYPKGIFNKLNWGAQWANIKAVKEISKGGWQ